MGMKLKSGADLCGFQLTNFCVQGEASAPSDAALGRKYFHTNATDDVATGISLLHRERIYLGEGAWRATAYLDDIANLQGKIDALDELLNGEDSQTYIDTWEEVKAFLEGVTESKDLMDLLNDKADKTQLADYLPLSGGTITSNANTILTLKGGASNSHSVAYFMNGDTYRGYVGWSEANGFGLYHSTQKAYLGIKDDGTPHYNGNTLIHSGNIGSQTVAAAKALVGQGSSASVAIVANHDNGSIKYGAGYRYIYCDYGGTNLEVWRNPVSGDANLIINRYGATHSITTIFGGSFEIYSKTWGTTDFKVHNGKVAIGTDSSQVKFHLVEDNDGSREITILENTQAKNAVFSVKNTVGNTFVATLEDGTGYVGTPVNKPLQLFTNNTARVTINSSGNVLIGTTSDNGEKFQVAGNICLKEGYFFFSGDAATGASNMYLSTHDAAGLNFRLSTGATRFFIATGSGNVGIGTTDPKYKLDVNGNAHISGNLIVDGEISAGGAGAEGGTSGSGSAEGVSEIFTPTSTSMVFNHNLGEDVIVQVYEKSGNVWNMVMVDVEITSATKVTLRFGKTETTQHKVVIMGV